MRTRRAPFWVGCGLLTGALLAATACIDPFDPQVDEARNDLLVVDGFINTRGVTSIKLSHAFGLKTKGAPLVETQARVWVEDERGAQFPLTETTPGTYASAARNLELARKYRLHFATKAGREYASDYTEAKVTPPIDSLTWEMNPRGLSVKVNTHDELRRSVYYRWNSDETWEFTSAVFSFYEYRNGQVVLRGPGNDIYHCWGQNKSTIISLGNSAALAQDRIADFKMLTLPASSEKLHIKYSVRVQQCAQTRDEYEYWEMLQKNTESIGGLFDPLPSQLTGNVHRLDDPAAPVLGYVGAYSVTEKRIFIDRTQLPRGWSTFVDPNGSCEFLLDVAFADVHAMFGHNILVPVNDSPAGYTAASPECVDCRLRGTNVRPLYWQ